MLDTNIYGLLDEDGLLRYVGKTRQLISMRLAAHWHDAQWGCGASPRLEWLRSLKRRPTPRFLEYVPTNGNSGARERYWIELAQDYGCSLVNAREGGKARRDEALQVIHDEVDSSSKAATPAQRATAECRLAKRSLLERKTAQRALDREQEHERNQADLYIRQIKSRRGNFRNLGRCEFEAVLKLGLEGYFAARPNAKECWLTTNQCLWLADLPDVPAQDQFEFFNILTRDKFMGCAMVAFDYWHFTRPTTQKPIPALDFTGLPSIFDK